MVLNQHTPVSVEQRLTKAIFTIVNHERYQWQAGLISLGTKEVCEPEQGIGTAATNGRDELYDRAFLDSLNDPELRYIVLHEQAHKFMRDLSAYEHLFRKNAELAGMAADYVNNLMLDDENKDGFAVMPVYKDGPYKGEKMGLVDEKYRGWNLERVFWDLYDKADNPDGDGEGEGGREGNGPPQGQLDTHDYEGYKALDEEERAAVDRDVEDAIRAGEALASKTGAGNSSGILGELLRTDIDYLAAMRQFLTTTCSGSEYSTWATPNRKYLSEGWYLPSGITEQADCVAFFNDTSGSCFTTEELRKFFTHIVAIIKALRVQRTLVGFWDTEVHTPIETYRLDEVDRIPTLTKPKGGGGTTPACIPEYLREHQIKPQAVVVLTDGEVWNNEWGTWDCPVLWVVPNKSRKIVAPVGTTIVCDI